MGYLSVKRAGALLFAGILGIAGCSGDSGDPGAAGSSCTVTQNGNGTATISCTDGTTATVASGTSGADGSSCTVKDNGNGTKTITCEDGTTVTVADGATSTGSVEIAKFHGAEVLQSEGEFAPCAPGVTSGCGKKFVDAQITSASADAAGVVTVNFTVENKDGTPLTDLGSVSALVAKLVPGANGSASKWVAYIYRKNSVVAPKPGQDWPAATGTFAWQPTSESSGTGASNGTLTNNGDGSYTYVFKKNLATATVIWGINGTEETLVGYDRSLTHRVSIMMGGHQGPTADANFDFRPDGGAIAERRDVVTTAPCLNCHGWEFHGHGGNRLTMENCVTCHVADTYDPHGGESLDMKVMIHKIHAGRELPSVHDAAPGEYVYALWGNSDTKHSWPIAEFPAVIENCAACHTGSAAQAANWKTEPTREACGSCHDDVDFATGANHPAPGGARADDSSCDGCHMAEGATWAVTESHAWTEDAAHKVDKRNFPEFGVELAVTNVPSRGYFIKGEAPIITLKLKDLEAAGTPYLDHTTILADGSAADDVEPCTSTSCAARDGKFRAAGFMVHGPRTKRMPALTTGARAQILSGGTGVPNGGLGPFDLSAAGAALKLKVDNGESLVAYYPTGGDYPLPGEITVAVPAAAKLTAGPLTYTAKDAGPAGANVSVAHLVAVNQTLGVAVNGTAISVTLGTNASGGVTSTAAEVKAAIEASAAATALVTVTTGTGTPAALASTRLSGGVPFADTTKVAVTAQEILDWLNADAVFSKRAIAFDQGGKVGIRSRNLGRVYALQLQAGPVTTAVFGSAAATTEIKLPAGNGSNNLGQRTDPKAVHTTDAVTYTLDPVDDVAPGTYVVSVEMADRGRRDTDVYKTPSVGWITFQVKQAAEEKLPAGNCNLCHQSAAGIGFVLDPSRHNKKFGFDAVDQCGPCHDYQRGSLTAPTSLPSRLAGTGAPLATWQWGSGRPISKRVHAVHRGADLNYSLATVDYDNGDPSGRDWQIHFTQDIRNCETCHPAGATSGTWVTKPARLPCSGCHDSDEATAHLRLNTWDPTPADPFSGDEQEACQTCH